MTEYLLGIVSGFLLHDLISYLRSKKQQQKETPPAIQPKKVLIELHDGVYFAFSNEDQFLGQNVSLEVLALELLGTDASLLLAASDPVVIEKLRLLISSGQLNHTADATNQEQ